MSRYSESAALAAFAKITHPSSGRDIVSAGLLGDLSFNNGLARAILLIDPNLPQDFEPARHAMEAALIGFDDVTKASVLMTAHKAAPAVKAHAPKRQGNPHKARRPEGYQGDAKIKRIIAVSSAKGGVGKSTVSVNLAVALSKLGLEVGLLDADIHGPSAPILLGHTGVTADTHRIDAQGEKTEDKSGRMVITPMSLHGITAMSIGWLTKDDGPVVWRGPMVQGAISKMLWDVDWGALDVLLIDMPPGTGDAQLGLAQDIKPHSAIIVSTPQDLALADARKGVAMFEKVDIPIAGVIENMSVFTCSECGTAHHIFGHGGAKHESEKLGVPFLGEAPLTMAIRESGDAGVPIAAGEVGEAEMFAEIARKMKMSLRSG